MSPVQQVALIEGRQLYCDILIPPLATLVRDVSFKAYASVSDVTPDLEQTCLLLFVLSSTDAKRLAEIVTGIQANPETASLRFAFIADFEEPRTIVTALELGTQGFIPSSLPLHQVAHALRLVLAGGIFVPAQSFRALSDSKPEQVPDAAQHGGLSPQQIRVAKALRRGTPNKTIAYSLNMAESTVKVHVRTIMKKLKARNRTEIAYLTNEYFKSIDE